MAKRQLGIFYIDANKGYFYGSNSTSILQVEIPADTLSYSDVVNKDKFYQLIQTLITTNKIEPVPLLILFSPYATYEKDTVGKTPDEINTDMEQFLDAVPYERVLSRTYKLQDKTKVVAVNKDMYEAIKRAFERLHFSTVAVVTLPLLQKTIPELGTNLNLEAIANKFETVKQYSLITQDEINNPGKANQQQEEKPKTNPVRIYALVGVFVVLLSVLIVMVMTTMQSPKRAVVNPPAVVTTAPSPTMTPFPTIRPTGGITATPSVQIVTPVVSKAAGNNSAQK